MVRYDWGMSGTGIVDAEPAGGGAAPTRGSGDTASPRAASPESVQQRARLPSIRLLITVIVVAPIAAVSIALISIATINSRAVSRELGHEIIVRARERVEADIRSYLGSAMRLSDLYMRRIGDKTLPTTNLATWERSLVQDILIHRDVASICFANPAGDCTWLLRHGPRLELGLSPGNARDRTVEWEVDLGGAVNREKPLRVYHYDATERPWFKIAADSGWPSWTPVYPWFPGESNASVMGTGYTRPVYDASGQLLGVLIIDVTLQAITDYVRATPIARSGHVYIVDEHGLLIAASDGMVNSPGGARLSPAHSLSPAAQAIAPLVSFSAHGPHVHAPEIQTVEMEIAGKPSLVQVTEIKPFTGIHWHIVTVLPESTFMANANSLRRRAILLGSGAIVGGIALGMLLSRRLADPLVRLTQHVARVGHGDFDSRLHLDHASELRELSDEVNSMASGLKQRMILEQALSVAEQVQQSLLPSALPQLPGMEVAACSRYCEATGGDYYDFIELPNLEGNKTLIAVGDVTGHGIGAALLMSTARGAVRASCEGAPSLGHVLTRTNNTLLGSSQQGMFMTLSIVFVNPQTRHVHWASAGHDPVIVYHPDSDSFEDLHSGDMPLGIDENVIYREFSRPCATPGALLLIGTDGIWEARNEHGEMFGKDRLRQLMRENHRSSENLSNAIKRAMFNWVGNRPLQDDVTFVVVKVLAQ
jgi:serine phosphatase RsbU (regulator of sigma subunit)